MAARSKAQRSSARIPPKRLFAPGTSEHQRVVDSVLRMPGVLGCFVGRRRRRGRTTPQTALVVLVEKKHPSHELPPESLLPKTIAWELRPDRRKALPIDVQALAGPIKFLSPAPVFGPGDGVRTNVTATVGASIEHPVLGRVVTTAGHAVMSTQVGFVNWLPNAYRVQIVDGGSNATVNGDVLRAARTEWCDYALIRPDPPAPMSNLYFDQYPIQPPHVPDSTEIGRPMWVLASAAVHETKLRGIAATMPIGVGGVMHGLVVTDSITQMGDSGAMLIDEHWRAVGMLVGVCVLEGTVYSVFMPAGVALWYERATWV